MILISPLFGEVSMSLVNVKSGRYIKVLRDQAIFTPQSVSVAYYSFVSKEAKEEFFARKRGVENFVLAVEDYLEVENERLTRDIEDYAKEKNLESVGSIDELPKKFRARIAELSAISKASFVVYCGWDGCEALPIPSNLEKLKELGFNEAWLTPMEPWEIATVNTGAFTNQNFTYECLYCELKKIFKDDFVDC